MSAAVDLDALRALVANPPARPAGLAAILGDGIIVTRAFLSDVIGALEQAQAAALPGETN